jgi:hypothetical protein
MVRYLNLSQELNVSVTDLSHSVAAPGWTGIATTWTSSAKDMVMTALGPSPVWATVAHGIVNEVYWPSAGRPQIRDPMHSSG